MANACSAEDHCLAAAYISIRSKYEDRQIRSIKTLRIMTLIRHPVNWFICPVQLDKGRIFMVSRWTVTRLRRFIRSQDWPVSKSYFRTQPCMVINWKTLLNLTLTKNTKTWTNIFKHKIPFTVILVTCKECGIVRLPPYFNCGGICNEDVFVDIYIIWMREGKQISRIFEQHCSYCRWCTSA